MLGSDVLIFFHHIGAAIRWTLGGFEGSVTDRVEQENPVVDFIIGIIACAMLLVVIISIARMRLLRC